MQRARLPAEGRRERAQDAPGTLGTRRSARTPRTTASASPSASATARASTPPQVWVNGIVVGPLTSAGTAQLVEKLEGGGADGLVRRAARRRRCRLGAVAAPERPLFVVSINTSSIARGAARPWTRSRSSRRAAASMSCGRATPASHSLSPSCRCSSRTDSASSTATSPRTSPSRSRRPPRQASTPDTRSA